MAEEGNGGASGIQGLPAPFVWVRMKRETRRSFPEHLRGVGWPVGVAMASGGNDDSRSWGGKQRSEGEGGPESEGEVRGGSGRWRGTRGGVQALGGKQELASYGRARVGHALCVRLARRGRRLCPWWAGPASAAGRTGRRQVDLLLSLSYFYLVLFSIFCSLF